MKFHIYHAKEPTFGFGDRPKFPEEYDFVAIVEAGNVADTFRITNHIDTDWQRNPEVVEIVKLGNRSTSVGDVVQDENGVNHYCASVGWEEMS
jgi:hypothetical protein